MLKGIKKRKDLISLFIAAIAVVLSQLPPIYQMFYSPKLDKRKIVSIALTPNAYSGLSLGYQFSVTNDGKDAGRIKSIEAYIMDEANNQVFSSMAQAYRLTTLSNFNQVQWEQFAEIALQPAENWSHFLTFSKSLNNQDLQRIKEIQDEIEEERKYWEFDMEEEGWDMDSFNADMPVFKVSTRLHTKLKEEILSTGKKYDYFVYEFEIKEMHIDLFSKSLESFINGMDPFMLPNIIVNMEYKNEKTKRKMIADLSELFK